MNSIQLIQTNGLKHDLPFSTTSTVRLLVPTANSSICDSSRFSSMKIDFYHKSDLMIKIKCTCWMSKSLKTIKINTLPRTANGLTCERGGRCEN